MPSMPSKTILRRSVDRILPKTNPHWVGDGFYVFPVFSDSAFTKSVSPLLMFDYAAPKEFKPMKSSSKEGKTRGVGMHPHRGFETVTIAFEGEVEHHDNHGGHGVIKKGDVQWMTAGKGIVHQEYHSREFSATGGVLEMAQLWVNLPKKHKLVKPRYQEIVNSRIPVIGLEEGDRSNNEGEEVSGAVAKVRLIAGKLPMMPPNNNGGAEAEGTSNDATEPKPKTKLKGPAKTYSPINLWDISLPSKDRTVRVPYPIDHACMVFVRRGAVSIGGKKIGPQEVAILKNTSENTCSTANEASEQSSAVSMIELDVLKNDSAVLVMGGEIIDEPIAHMGPFAMNTQEELQQAMMDYRAGRF